MRVYVTARGDSYHSTPSCGQIVAGQRAARNNGNEVHPAREMSLQEAQAWKPVTQCPRCWNDVPADRSNVAPWDAVEVRYEIGFGPAATTAKGWLSIPRPTWDAILPEDRDARILELIKEQAMDQLRTSYRTIK